MNEGQAGQHDVVLLSQAHGHPKTVQQVDMLAIPGVRAIHVGAPLTLELMRTVVKSKKHGNSGRDGRSKGHEKLRARVVECVNKPVLPSPCSTIDEFDSVAGARAC